MLRVLVSSNTTPADIDDSLDLRGGGEQFVVERDLWELTEAEYTPLEDLNTVGSRVI